MHKIMSGADEFYRENYKPLYKYLCSLTGNPTIAEDITHEVFMTALVSPGSFDGKSSVLTWLCSVGKNKYLNIIRRSENKNVAIDNISEIGYEENDFSNIEKKEIAAHILKILDDFDDIKKELFILRVYAELPYCEIAARLGKTEAWARTSYFRIKNEICERFKEDGYEL